MGCDHAQSPNELACPIRLDENKDHGRVTRYQFQYYNGLLFTHVTRCYLMGPGCLVMHTACLSLWQLSCGGRGAPSDALG